jgi:hypothetical protein
MACKNNMPMYLLEKLKCTAQNKQENPPHHMKKRTTRNGPPLLIQHL